VQFGSLYKKLNITETEICIKPPINGSISIANVLSKRNDSAKGIRLINGINCNLLVGRSHAVHICMTDGMSKTTIPNGRFMV